MGAAFRHLTLLKVALLQRNPALTKGGDGRLTVSVSDAFQLDLRVDGEEDAQCVIIAQGRMAGVGAFDNSDRLGRQLDSRTEIHAVTVEGTVGERLHLCQ